MKEFAANGIAPSDTLSPDVDETAAWRRFLSTQPYLRKTRASGVLRLSRGNGVQFDAAADAMTGDVLIAFRPGPHAESRIVLGPAASENYKLLCQLYGPMCRPADGIRKSFVLAHLGQSLDGRIATVNGASHYVTGAEDILHNHRLRALCDAIIVGANTVASDDPQLTVRLCDGTNPVRVVIDPQRRSNTQSKIFQDGEAETVLVCGRDAVQGQSRHGRAEIVGIDPVQGRLAPNDIAVALRERGLVRLYVEGGGRTVSNFLQAGALDVLHITIAPLIVGSGIPSIQLPAITDLADGYRPRTRHFSLGKDLLIECRFD